MTTTHDSLTIADMLDRLVRSEGAVKVVELLAAKLHGSEEAWERHLAFCLDDALTTQEEVYGEEESEEAGE